MKMAQDLTAMSHEKGMKVLQIIWGAMVFSVGVYAAIAWMVRTRAVGLDPGGGDIGGGLTMALGAVSVGLLLAQIKLRQNLMDKKLFPRILDLGSWGLRPDVAEQFKELQVPERGIQLILQAHVIFGVVIWAMAEAVAVFGLVLSLVTGDPRLMGIFGSVALVQLIWFRPRERAFKEQLRRWGRYVEMNRGRLQEPAPSTQDPGGN
jgi:hypothetical protein